MSPSNVFFPGEGLVVRPCAIFLSCVLFISEPVEMSVRDVSNPLLKNNGRVFVTVG
jgi:hypothetical protein